MGNFMSLKSIVENNDTVGGRIFDFTFQFLIILSLISFSIETLPNLTRGFRGLLNTLEAITVVLFTFEYILRLLVADKKLKFVFSFYGIIDLLAILPFYISFFISRSVDLRSIRILRLFRLFRAFKLVRYNKALQRFGIAFKMIREELIVFLFATVLLLFISSVGIYYFENEAQPDQFKSVFHSLWWAITTLTTVGYGDIYPITLGGKMFTFFVLILGLGIVAVPTGLLASALTKSLEDE